MNKEELNKEVAKLKQYIDSHAEQVKDLEHDLKVATQRLEDADKPKLTEKQFEAIQAAIENSVENFTFDDADGYETEFGIEYDGRVYLSSIIFDGHSTLCDQIYQDVEKLFGITEESDTDSNQTP
jgi:uncharacterized protein (DUF342 family)